MSVIGTNSHVLYREIYQNHHHQCLLVSGGGYLFSPKTGCENIWIDSRNRECKIRRRNLRVQASWWGPDVAKTSVIEMEAINDSDHMDQILHHAQQNSQPIIIDWMAAWCRKCIYLKPKLEKLAAEFDTKVKFYYVDVNKVPQSLVKRGNISKMPTIQLWKDGEMKAEVIGGHKGWLVIEEVREMIQNFRGTIMKRTQRFKRVAEPRSPVLPREPDDNKPVQKSRRCKPKPQKQNKPHHPISDSLSISESNIKIETLPRNFFQIDALDLAPRLLGKFLRRDDVVLQITEVEAYRPNDSACHGRFGITPRTAPVFGPGGHAYVYLCYGLHMMLNVVADKEGAGAAVLIRSCAPISGLDVIQQRRGQKTDKPVLLTGPGKVGQALGLSTEWSNHPLYTPGGLELLDGPEPENILVGPRVGIQYALPEHVNALWRFAIAGTPWISAPRNTLRPP